MIDQNKHTEQTAKAKFGRPMRPCPCCGGYNLVARLWMKLDWDGHVEEGMAYIVCDGCRWKPIKIVDIKGRTFGNVYKNSAIHDEAINLWNSQEAQRARGKMGTVIKPIEVLSVENGRLGWKKLDDL